MKKARKSAARPKVKVKDLKPKKNPKGGAPAEFRKPDKTGF